MIGLFDLRKDSASMEEIYIRIEKDSTVQGPNLVILVTAVLIACVGLNMNSVAVIIGAMLISPLMGGIVAIGYGMATYDIHFIKQSVIKLGFQVGFALLASTIYFSLTPISTPSSELIARTSPTIWDVLIALCGGIAGAVGNTRIEKSNVIPGVAIATALMPPLCTAGYGITMHSLKFFGGAIYLFFINGFFIALSSFLIFKLLRVPIKNSIGKEHFKRQQTLLWIIGILITVPSIYMAYQSVDANIADFQVKNFISKEADFDTSSIVSYQFDNGILTIDLIGMPLTDKEIDNLKKSMKHYSKLDNAELRIVQTNSSDSLNKEQIQQIINTKIHNETKDDNGKSYKELANQYYPDYKRTISDQKIILALKKQAPTLFPEIIDIKGGSIASITEQQKVNYQTFIAFVTVQKRMSSTNAEKLKNWIGQQVKIPVLLYISLQNSNEQDIYGTGIE
jgi:uncharacterized hydrophobic protein (TIGR00271 family)